MPRVESHMFVPAVWLQSHWFLTSAWIETFLATPRTSSSSRYGSSRLTPSFNSPSWLTGTNWWFTSIVRSWLSELGWVLNWYPLSAAWHVNKNRKDALESSKTLSKMCVCEYVGLRFIFRVMSFEFTIFNPSFLDCMFFEIFVSRISEGLSKY